MDIFRQLVPAGDSRLRQVTGHRKCWRSHCSSATRTQQDQTKFSREAHNAEPSVPIFFSLGAWPGVILLLTRVVLAPAAPANEKVA